MLRLVSPHGLSPGHPFVVTADSVVLEGQSNHNDPTHSQPLEVPTLLAGKLRSLRSFGFISFTLRKPRQPTPRELVAIPIAGLIPTRRFL